MTGSLEQPPKRRSRLPWIIGGVVAAVLVVGCGAAVVLGVYAARNSDWSFSHTGMPSPSPAAGPVNIHLVSIGTYDCLSGKVPGSRISFGEVNLTKVDCDDKAADYQVTNASTGVPRPEGREIARYCQDDKVIAAVWASYDGARGTVLCLGLVFFVSS